METGREKYKIGICGCVAQQKANKVFSRAPYVDFVLGTHKIYSLPEVVKKLITAKEFANAKKQISLQKMKKATRLTA